MATVNLLTRGMMVMRKTKVDYYLDIAREVASRSPCARRKFGAVIVQNDTIISTGYNGSARGTLNCGLDVPCIKDVAAEPALVSYDKCPAIHAEQNAILYASSDRRIGATLYLASSTTKHGGRPCHLCRRYIIQSGIEDIWYLDKDGNKIHENVEDWIGMENEWMTTTLDEIDPTWQRRMLDAI